MTIQSELRQPCVWCGNNCDTCATVENEAADLIDTLTAENSRLRELNEQVAHDLRDQAQAVGIAKALVERQQEEIARLQSNVKILAKALESASERLAAKCEHPGAETCAKLWNADASREQLASIDPALCEEFPWGCDTLEHVASALVAERAERRRLQAIVDRLPTTPDGAPIVPGMVLYDGCGHRFTNPDVCTGFDTRNGRLALLHFSRGFDTLVHTYYATREAVEKARNR